jgi:HAD superfamily hydrolase (TIGR01509 family)
LLLAVNRICASCCEQQEIISRNFGLLVNLQELVVKKKKKQQRRLAMAMASILATDLTRCCICYTSAIASASSSLSTRSRLITAEKKQKKTKKKLLNSGKLLQSVSKEWRWKNNPDPLVVAPAAVAAASGSPLQEGVARRSSTREETSVSSEEETSSNDVQESAVRGVLFDMDGVLCDSEHCSREAGVALFAEMSISVTAEDFVPFMGTGEANFLGGVAKKYGVKDFDPVSAKQRFFQIYIDKYAKPNSGLDYPGALDLILQCKAAGLKLAVASSADRIKVDANLAAAGLPQSNFDAIVSADLFKNLKPSPDIFFAAAKGLGLPPKECVVIEDALAGVQAATAAGMRCIAVTTTLSEDKLMQAGPALVRKDISHISLNDILELDQDEGAGSKFSVNGKNEVEESSNNLQALFNVEIPLPGGSDS